MAVVLGGLAVAAFLSFDEAERREAPSPSAAGPGRGSDAQQLPPDVACEHPWLHAARGATWRYRFLTNGSHVELEMTVEDVRRAAEGIGLQVGWRATSLGRADVRRFTTHCAEAGVELPLDGFTSKPIEGEFEGPTCPLPSDLQLGLEVADDARSDVGSVRRICTVRGVSVSVEVPAGSFDAFEIEVAERGMMRDEELTSQGTWWVARDVGIVKAQYGGSVFELIEVSDPSSRR